MKFSGKICFKIVLKVTKYQSFNLSLEHTFFEKPQGGSQIDLPPFPSPAVLGLKEHPIKIISSKKMKMNLLTKEQQESDGNTKIGYICKNN